MAREIELRVWCDPCMQIDGERVEGEEMLPIIIGRAKPKVIAMCTQHKEDFWDPFVEAIQKMGETQEALSVERVRKAPGTATTAPAARKLPGSEERNGLQCPLKGEIAAQHDMAECAQTGLASLKSVQSHLRTVHGMNMFEAIGKDGQVFHDDGQPLTPMPEIRAYKKRVA